MENLAVKQWRSGLWLVNCRLAFLLLALVFAWTMMSRRKLTWKSLPVLVAATLPTKRNARLMTRRQKRGLAIQPLELRRMLVAEGTPIELSESVSIAGLVGEVTAEVNFGDGTTSAATVIGDSPPGSLQVDFNFSRDLSGFFDQPGAREALQYAAQSLTDRLQDQFTAIGANEFVTVTPLIVDPATLDVLSLPQNPIIAANTVEVYVGAQDLGGNTAGLGGPGGFSLQSEFQFSSEEERQRIESEIEAFNNNVLGRGQSGALGTRETATDFAFGVGSVTFDEGSGRDWYFGIDPAGIQPGQTDFITIAVHELGHVFGFGTANSWFRLASPTGFTGAASRAVHPGSGNVPLEPDSEGQLVHWAQEVLLTNPTIQTEVIDASQRGFFSELDFAALQDIGFEVSDLDRTITATQTFADDGVFPSSVTLTDSGGGTLEVPLGSTTVTNVAPTLTVAPDQQATVGQAISIADIATIADPGFQNLNVNPPTLETFSFTIDWGDGTIDSGTAEIDRQGQPGITTLASLDGSHVYDSVGTRTVVITVQDDDGGTTTGEFQVTVGPQPELSLVVGTSLISEDGGPGVTTLTVSSSVAAPPGGLQVNLVSSDPSEVSLAPNATIPAGSSSVTIPVTAVDDDLLDGTVVVTLLASVSGAIDASVVISVSDAEQISGTFSSPAVTEGTSDAVVLTVRRSNNDLDDPVQVQVGGPTSELGVPSIITLAPGQQELQIGLSPPDNADPQLQQSITLDFAAAGYIGSSSGILLLDDEPPLFQNQTDRFDVDDSQTVTVFDALLIINTLAQSTTDLLDPEQSSPGGTFVDVNGDYRITPLDALEIINEIARRDAAGQLAAGATSVATPPQIAAAEELDDEDRRLQRNIDAAIATIF